MSTSNDRTSTEFRHSEQPSRSGGTDEPPLNPIQGRAPISGAAIPHTSDEVPVMKESAAAVLNGQLPTYVTLDQAAQITEQSVKTIRRRIADGTLPAYRFGGRNIRIRLDDLEAAARLIPAARSWADQR